jgi:hypothetical protein
MASKTQKTEAVRARKAKSNKINMKQDEKRLAKNLDVLKKVSQEE